MGPEELLGGYFLTPQTNPPTPWPAERFADLFTREVTEGMVVPRVERRGPAGLVATDCHRRRHAPPPTRACCAAPPAPPLATGVPVSFGAGADAVADLEVVLDEGLSGRPGRRRSSAPATQAAKRRRARRLRRPRPSRRRGRPRSPAAGHAERVLLSTGGGGLPFGHDAARSDVRPRSSRPCPRRHGAHQVLVANPRALLTVKER